MCGRTDNRQQSKNYFGKLQWDPKVLAQRFLLGLHACHYETMVLWGQTECQLKHKASFVTLWLWTSHVMYYYTWDVLIILNIIKQQRKYLTQFIHNVESNKLDLTPALLLTPSARVIKLHSGGYKTCKRQGWVTGEGNSPLLSFSLLNLAFCQIGT